MSYYTLTGLHDFYTFSAGKIVDPSAFGGIFPTERGRWKHRSVKAEG